MFASIMGRLLAISLATFLLVLPPSASYAVDQGHFSLDFDGVDDFAAAEVTAASRPNFSAGFTVELWVKPTSLTLGAFTGIVRGAFDIAPDFRLVVIGCSSGTILIRLTGDYRFVLRHATSAQSGPGGLVTGKWQHIAATYDGTDIRIYYNGTLIATTPHSAPGPISNTFNYFTLGKWADTSTGR